MNKYILSALLICISVSRLMADEVETRVQETLAKMSLADKVEQINIQPDKSKKDPKMGPRSQAWNKELNIGPILATNGPRGPKQSGSLPANRSSQDKGKGPCSPTALCLASSWNTELQFEAGRQWGLLTKEYGLNTIWAPGINMIKDPRAGRNAEYVGEDPFLAGKFGTAITQGLQSVGVAANAKHFVANNWETGRKHHNVTVPVRLLRELYLPAFQMCVEEGKVWSIMTCYNQVNGEWGSASQSLLTDIVRKEWGFTGFFVSDWDAKFGSAAQAIKAGQNIELPGQVQFRLNAVKAALDAGEITMKEIDARVTEILRLKFKHLTYYGDETPSGYDLKGFQNMMRNAGTEGLVLLKNKEELLPLSRKSKVALIGPFAASEVETVGNQGSSTIPASYAVTLKKALEQQGVTTTFAEGCGPVAYTNAQFVTPFACRMEYFNDQELTGKPVFGRDLAALNVPEFLDESTQPIEIEGVSGKALRCAGRGAIQITRTPESKAWTLAGWVRTPEQFPNPKGVFFGLSNKTQAITVRGGSLETAPKGGSPAKIEVSWKDLNNRWIPVVIVATGESVKLYREGKLVAEAPKTGSFASMDIRVGGDKNNQNGMAMDLDELKLWNRALTEVEIGDLAAGKAVNAPVETLSLENAQVTGGSIPGIKDRLNMSARATGKIQLEKPGKVAFRIECNGGVRVKIDGQLVYDLWDEQAGEGVYQYLWYRFDDTKPHDVVVEFSSKNRKASGYLQLDYALPPEPEVFAEARKVAAEADVAVVCVGVSQVELQGENRDRGTYALPSWQDELVKAVYAANPKTVVVLFTAGGSDLRHWIDEVPAVLEAFHPGSEGGNIVSDVLFGDVNPSGRLTISWPLNETDLAYTGPNPHYHDTVNEFGYRYFDAQKKPVRFPFGYGLSYTSFAYEGLKVVKSENPKYPATATVTVKNTGKVAGKEVVQVYVGAEKSAVEQPVRELGGYIKVDLKPGESKTVEIPLHWTAFQYFDVKQNKWVLEPGKYTVSVAHDSRDVKLEGSIEF